MMVEKESGDYQCSHFTDRLASQSVVVVVVATDAVYFVEKEHQLNRESRDCNASTTEAAVMIMMERRSNWESRVRD